MSRQIGIVIFIFTFSILDWIVFSGTQLLVSVPAKQDGLSVSSTGSFSLEPRKATGNLAQVQLLSVSSTGSFSLEPYCHLAIGKHRTLFQYPRLDRFLWNLFIIVSSFSGPVLSVSSTGSFSLEPSLKNDFGYLIIVFQYPRLDRFLWNPWLDSPSKGSHFLFQYPRLDRFLWNP